VYRYIRRRLGSISASLVELNRDSQAQILLAVAGGWFLSIGIRLIYPVVLPHLRIAFGFDLATAGLLLTVLWVVYALGQLPGGILSDRFGAGRVMIVGTTAAGITVLLIVLSPTIEMLFTTTALLGLCTALFGPARFPMLSAVFPNRAGTAIGSVQAAGNLGNTVLPFIAGVLASAGGWQLGFGFVSPLFAIGTFALWYTVPRQPSTTTVETLSDDAIHYLLADFTNRSVLVILAIQVLGSGMYQGFTSFYPTYLVEIKGLSSTVASGLFGAFFAMGMLIPPITGGVGDRFGERPTLLVILALSTVMLATLPFVTGVGGLVGITIGLSAILGRGVLALTYLTKTLSEETRGTGLGLLRTGYITTGAVSPLLIGILADRGYFDEAFWLLSGSGVVMVLLCSILPELEEE